MASWDHISRNDIALILLALFILWNKFPEIFYAYWILLRIYQDYCWSIWKDVIQDFQDYILFVIKNILQIKNSQIDTKLDKDFWKATNKHVIKVDLFNGKSVNIDNEEDVLREKNREDLDMFNTNSYLYVVTIVYIE